MAVNVQRTDLYVGMFLVATVALVAIALIATSGWGVDRYDVFVRTDNAQDVAVDTKIYMQGLEVGRVAAIASNNEMDNPSRREVATNISAPQSNCAILFRNPRKRIR